MIEEISAFFTIEMIYLWVNIAVIPLWFLLIFMLVFIAFMPALFFFTESLLLLLLVLELGWLVLD